MSEWKFITPLVKQCFVASGVAVNMAGATMMLAYPSGMVLQLKRPDSEIPIDRSEESWIAAMPSVAGLLGSLLTAISMARYGRRLTQIASIISLIGGWLIIDCANGFPVILLGRFFHGLALGSSLYIGPVLVGEYSSPKYRGAFMMLPGFLAAVNVMLSHTIGLYLHWKTNAIICTAVAAMNLPIAILSPESPSWLATRQRFEECRRAFRWLRGTDEEEELAKMINASAIVHKLHLEKEQEKAVKKTLVDVKDLMTKKAFYKPIIIMLHVYTSGQWAGSHLMTTYVFNIIYNIIGEGKDEHVIDLNIHRIIASVLAMYIITKTKRKIMFLTFSGANVLVLLSVSAYTYIRTKGILPFDSPIIGLVLMHLHMFFLTTCTLPMPYVIAGEIFPLKYKSVAGALSFILVSINTSVYMKTFPYLLSYIGIYGAYTLYAGVILYCLLISYLYLPETKDRTLLEIENEMIGERFSLDEVKAVQALISEPQITESGVP